MPIQIEGEESLYFIWNVTATNASYDEARTVRKLYPNGTYGMPTKYAFQAELIAQPMGRPVATLYNLMKMEIELARSENAFRQEDSL